MNEQLISFKTAILAKEKGFEFNNKRSQNDYQGEYPTQSLLQKWLREEYKINVYCMPCLYDENLWFHNIASRFKVFVGTYEEALEDGLYQTLKLIKNDEK